ncbi:MAG: type II toxin-antitoxin system RelB/DinJ family antitoxin [Candidatus Pacebacteria bacterium]|nr:type II toxin-antitoxin system RelB/DinJ family antitoxin [Candidatus Paceibacterota bacterium]
MKTMLNIKVDSDLKSQAQKVASELGLSLSAILSNSLKELVQEKRVVFSSPLEPNAKTKKFLDEALEEIKKGKTTSFKNTKEMDDYLMSL